MTAQIQPGLRFFTIYCHQPWGWLWPPARNRRHFCLLIFCLRTSLPCEFSGSPQYNPLHSSQPSIYTKILLCGPCGTFCETGDTPTSDSECLGSQNQDREPQPLAQLEKQPAISQVTPWNLFFTPRYVERKHKDLTLGHVTKENCEVDQVSLCNSFHSRIPVNPHDARLEIELWKECIVVDKTLVRRLSFSLSSATTLLCDNGKTTMTLRCSAASLSN